MEDNIFERQPEWEQDLLRRAIRAAGVALWNWHLDTDEFKMDGSGCALGFIGWRPAS